MPSEYALLKFAHIFIAIVALGTSAGLGIVLEFYASDRKHGGFILRAITRVVSFVVLPGYILMLVTGAWLARMSWSFDMRWIQAALGLWGVGAVFLGMSLVTMRKQRRLAERENMDSASYRRVVLLSRLFGGGAGFAVVLILYLMVVKPS